MPHARASLLALLALLGCSQESPGPGVEYTLHLIPVLPSNQDPFGELTRLEVEIAPAVGSATVVPMDLPGSGGTGVIDGLPEFEDAVITVRGYDGDVLVATGHTTAVSLLDGDELEIPVLFSEVDQFGWLTPFDRGLYAGEILALGDGRFRVFGGIGNTDRGKIGVQSDVIWEIDVSEPGSLPAFTEVGTLPEWTEGDGSATHTERAGFRMMPLSTGPHAGEYLMLGGSVEGVCTPSSEVTDTAFYYDPVAGSFTALEETIPDGRESYAAVVDARGNILLQGGAIFDARNSGCVVTSDIVRFNTADEEFERITGGTALGLVGAIGASVGNDGTLFCGGVALESDGWSTADDCEVVALDGTSATPTDPLPVSVTGAGAVTLADGRVLVAGGAHASGTVSFGTALGPAVSDAWLFDEGQWTVTANKMSLPRAGHSMTLLPDGRVLVVGGANTWEPFFISNEGLACAEIFDPRSNTFTALSDCTADDALGDLEDRTQSPLLAVDPDWGVLIAGGGKDEEAAQGAVALFVPAPE